VHTRDTVTEIEFDHPPINVYDVAARDQLCEVLTAVIADPHVRVLVFTAAGEHFSAGADLHEFGTAPSLFTMRDARWARDVWGLLRAVRVPMVAVMQGNCVGFGFELALQCDFRVVADDCVVALPEALVGMLPAGGATQTLPRLVGASAALAMIISGDRVPAAQARARGFVDEVVPRGALREAGAARADALAARPPAAVQAAKEAVWSALDQPLGLGLGHETDLAAVLRDQPAAR
jgi:enoyl-CoA hydratase/3-hydroxypropionyl-coenzyme A dehydratase